MKTFLIYNRQAVAIDTAACAGRVFLAGIPMKGSTDIMCRPSSPMRLAPTFQHRSLRSVRGYPWVIGAVLLGHVALAALLTQLPVQQLMPVSHQPIEIRWVELTPPPKPEPKPELPKPQSKPEPKPEPPKPESKPEPEPVSTPKPIPASKPVAIAKPQPVVAAPKPISSIKPTPVPAPQPLVTAAAVLSPPVAPVLSTTTVVPAPRVVVPVVAASNNPIAAPAAPAAPPQAVSTVNNAPRTVAIDGISYLKAPIIRFEPRSQAEYDAIGLLLLDLSVDADGKVTQVSIKQSSGNRRYDAAISYAMKRTKFNPYRVDGVAQPFTVTAPFEKSPPS